MNAAAAMPPPGLSPFATVRVQVGELVSLGDAPAGERRCVALLGGTVEGPGLQGEVLPGGNDWQWRRTDGVLEIDAQYIVRTADGALVEVRSQGLRHGPPEVMAALARGEAVPPDAYVFRTLMRFTTGAPAWQHLNRVMALASGQREARAVLLRAWAIG